MTKIRGTSARRIDGFYRDELATPASPSNTFAERENIVRILLNNLSDRVARKVNDAAAQRTTANLTAEVDELDRIGRIYAVLQSPQMAGCRGDGDAGAKAIVEILRQAREDFGAESKTVKEAPVEAVEPEQEPEPKPAASKTTDSRRRLGIRGN